MSWSSRILARMGGLFRRNQLEHELDAELQFHLEMQVEDNLRAGMDPKQARYAALRSFGAMEPTKESYREGMTFVSFGAAAQDLRYAVRTLRKSPGFAVTSVATLAIAIAAVSTMFSVVDTVLLRPLPFRAPEQLVMLWAESPDQNLREGRSSYLSVEQWRQQSKTVGDMAVIDPLSMILGTSEGAEQVSVARVSPNFFPLLGVQPVHGRTFTEQEAEQRQRLVVISHRFWQARYGGSPAALGMPVDLDGVRSRIIGILPAASRVALLHADVWEPHTLFPDWEQRRGVTGAQSWLVVGRLGRGVTLAQAQAEMSAIAARLNRERTAPDSNRGISLAPLGLYVIGGKARLAIWMLSGAVVAVLLIAATNVASLSLARSIGRQRELAVRTALGASAFRIGRQLLVESVTLAAISGFLGCCLALALVSAIRVIGPLDIPRLDEIKLDLRALGWSSAISLLTGLLVGLSPVVHSVRGNRRQTSIEGGRSVSGGVTTRRIRSGLVAAQFALSITLLAGAGLLIRSWWNVESVDPGFQPERVLSLQLSTPESIRPTQRVSFYEGVLQEIEGLPGVEKAGLIGDLFVGGSPEQVVTVEDGDRTGSERLRMRRDEVSSGTFQVLGTPLLQGRFFSREDGPLSQPVAIINKAMAQHLWRGREPIGRRFKLGPRDSRGPWFTVVGVVKDMRREGLENEPIPQMFEALAQNPSRLATLLVRTSADDPLQMTAAVQSAVRRVDKHTPVYGITSLENKLADSLVHRRLQTWLLMGFAAVALVMAAVGIYGLIQYSISTRTREIGIRLAIGAQKSNVVRMVLREGMALSLTGLVLGMVAALWIGEAASSLLFGVTARDPLTFAAIALLLTSVAAAACYLPARRAANIEPVTALRQE